MTAITVTPRERQIWALVVAGYVKKEIAQQLHRSEHTVSMTMRRLYAKLNIRKETDLVREYFVYMGYVTAAELRQTLRSAQVGIMALFLSVSAVQMWQHFDARPLRAQTRTAKANGRQSRNRKTDYYYA